jgi:hypothetical protein
MTIFMGSSQKPIKVQFSTGSKHSWIQSKACPQNLNPLDENGNARTFLSSYTQEYEALNYAVECLQTRYDNT